MSDVVIRVENLSKEYRLGTISHGTLYRDIQSGWAKLRGTEDPNTQINSVNLKQLNNNTNDRFSALKDVSFDVCQGEIVGIIGRNGAGKSTLLKIISRVTAPTSGTIKIKGRVASLLEVGTGFHPELTGRENIFLNGAILGMHKGEIEQKFDEIVKFSEIDKFIDTPVKRYSSGMYVRLAFAVAAHLEPEILVVDEVLAVGDAQFQKKCLGKMGAVAKEGRTVLFVSHNMGAIKQLCSTSIFINLGMIQSKGDVQKNIDLYLNAGSSFNNCEMKEYYWSKNRPGDDTAQLHSIRLCMVTGESCSNYCTDEPICIETKYEITKQCHSFRIGISLFSIGGTYLLYSSDDDFTDKEGTIRSIGCYISRCVIPQHLLNVGTYYLFVSGEIYGNKIVFQGLPKLEFTIHPGKGPSCKYNENRKGILLTYLPWDIIPIGNKRAKF